MQYPLMIKTKNTSSARNKSTFFTQWRVSIKTLQHIFNSENLSLRFKSGTKYIWLLTLVSQQRSRVPSQGDKIRNTNEGSELERKGKIILFAYDIVVYLEKSKRIVVTNSARLVFIYDPLTISLVFRCPVVNVKCNRNTVNSKLALSYHFTRVSWVERKSWHARNKLDCLV